MPGAATPASRADSGLSQRFGDSCRTHETASTRAPARTSAFHRNGRVVLQLLQRIGSSAKPWKTIVFRGCGGVVALCATSLEGYCGVGAFDCVGRERRIGRAVPRRYKQTAGSDLQQHEQHLLAFGRKPATGSGWTGIRQRNQDLYQHCCCFDRAGVGDARNCPGRKTPNARSKSMRAHWIASSPCATYWRSSAEARQTLKSLAGARPMEAL